MSRVRSSALAAAIAAAVVAGSSAVSAATSKLAYEDTVKPGESSSVTVVVRRPAAFSVNLKAPSTGRTRVFLQGGGGAPSAHLRLTVRW
jgi:hypothetical protein